MNAERAELAESIHSLRILLRMRCSRQATLKGSPYRTLNGAAQQDAM